jgi:hypothetical protein
MKKIIALSSLAALALVSAKNAYADYQLYSDSNHVYMDAGVEAYHYQTPNVDSGAGNASGNSLKAASSDGNSIMPTAKLGYHFDNEFLTSLFGPKANLELDGSFFSHSTSQSQNDLGLGYLTTISGDPYGYVPANDDIKNYYFNSKDQYENLGFYFKGEQYTGNQAITLNPFVGLVYTHFSEDDQYGFLYDTAQDPSNPNFDPYNASENVKTNYYGLTLGNQFNFQLTQHLFINAGGQLQLLRATSSLNGTSSVTDQTPGYSYSDSVNDSLSTFTYRGTLSASTAYHFTLNTDSPSVGLNLGIDRWGYTPEVVNPVGNASGNQQAPAHLEKSSSVNLFAGAYFHLPL